MQVPAVMMRTVLAVGSEQISGVLEVTVVTPAFSVTSREISGSPKTALGIEAKVMVAVGMVTAPEDRATPKTIKMAEIKAVTALDFGFISLA